MTMCVLRQPTPFDRFAIEPEGADREAVGRVGQDEENCLWPLKDAILAFPHPEERSAGPRLEGRTLIMRR